MTINRVTASPAISATGPAAMPATQAGPGFGRDVNHVASAPATKLDPWQLISNLLQQYHGVFRFFRTLRKAFGSTVGVVRAAQRLNPVVEASPAAQKAGSFVARTWDTVCTHVKRGTAYVQGLKSGLVERFSQTFLGRGLKAADAEAGRAAGRAAIAIDRGLEGTRLGQTIHVSGSGGRLAASLGGRMPVVGALMGGVVGAIDVRRAILTIRNPHATTRQRWLAGAQGAMSGLSGLFGLGALGVAAAGAMGLALPVSVPILLMAGAAAGAASFIISFFGTKPAG